MSQPRFCQNSPLGWSNRHRRQGSSASKYSTQILSWQVPMISKHISFCLELMQRITGETATRKRTFQRSQCHTANPHRSLSLIATRVLTLFAILTFPTNGFNWSEIKSDSNVCRPCQQNFWRLSTNICFLVQQIFVAAYGAGTGYLLVSSPNLISPTGFIHKADKKHLFSSK